MNGFFKTKLLKTETIFRGNVRLYLQYKNFTKSEKWLINGLFMIL